MIFGLDFRRNSSSSSSSSSSTSQFEFEKDETAEMIETAFTQLPSGQEVRFKKDDVCLEPYGRYEEATAFKRKRKRCTFKWWLNDVQSSGRGSGGGGGAVLLKFAFADDSDFFGEGTGTSKLHLHCNPPERIDCLLSVLPFRKSSYRFRLVVHQIDSELGRAYFALHSAAFPQQCIGKQKRRKKEEEFFRFKLNSSFFIQDFGHPSQIRPTPQAAWSRLLERTTS